MATKKSSLRERLQKRREDLKRSGPGKFFTCKEGITRVRILPVGEENEWGLEVTYFYLGLKDNMALISPATFNEKCAVMDAYTKLSNSKDPADREFAKKFKPSRRFMAPVIKYKDDNGKEIDTESGVKLLLMTGGVYQEAIDLYLDDDNGDFTDPIKGYDLKIKRTGKGKTDTEYKVLTGKVSKLAKEYRAEVDLEKMVREIIPTYKETKVILEEFLNLPPKEDDEEEEAPKKKTSKKKRSKDL